MAKRKPGYMPSAKKYAQDYIGDFGEFCTWAHFSTVRQNLIEDGNYLLRGRILMLEMDLGPDGTPRRSPGNGETSFEVKGFDLSPEVMEKCYTNRIHDVAAYVIAFNERFSTTQHRVDALLGKADIYRPTVIIAWSREGFKMKFLGFKDHPTKQDTIQTMVNEWNRKHWLNRQPAVPVKPASIIDCSNFLGVKPI